MADVNIPVGEVFTSPVLEERTEAAYRTRYIWNGLNYKNLEIDLKDGMVEKYTCTNFEDEAENKNYIRDNVLMHHETLPMGELQSARTRRHTGWRATMTLRTNCRF